ncbi:MAG: cell division protein ZapE [Inquilinus sp.]|nr:cell division protein ZapE [Inquilinus sp.]
MNDPAKTAGPLAALRALRRAGTLKPDPCQELAAEKLQSLHHALAEYRPSSDAAGWRARFGLSRRRDPAPQGLYLFGGVGRGKSMLMDLFFDSAPVERRRRVHFHQFMLDVHDWLHRWRTRARDGGEATKKGDDPIPPLARDLAAEAWLLCFDEFHVVDVADAMILGRLFTALFELGVVVVATSNWAPDDLYKDGLQRDRFLPFIALLKERLDVLELDGGVDYRLARLMGVEVYHQPLGPAALRALEQAFATLTGGAAGVAATLELKGRRLEIPRAAKEVAWFTFEELCDRPLGAADYLALATHYRTVIVAGVPVMGEAERNQAKRFMTLIDALYEHKAKTVIAAEAVPQELYRKGTGALDFQRTVSRLMEMQSAEYLAAPHLA